MKISEFPIEIVKRIAECCEEQGNMYDEAVFKSIKTASAASGGFCWDQTKEGDKFWADIINREQFDVFFKKYPSKLEPTQEEILELAFSKPFMKGDIVKCISLKHSTITRACCDFNTLDYYLKIKTSLEATLLNEGKRIILHEHPSNILDAYGIAYHQDDLKIIRRNTTEEELDRIKNILQETLIINKISNHERTYFPTTLKPESGDHCSEQGQVYRQQNLSPLRS